jgi:protein farnesyltransferase/geranylgeranyltransferase type-1 subunit alpha
MSFRVTKQAISLVPNNPSAWNYLRGVLEHMKVPFSELKDFVAMYASPREPGPSAFDDTDLENPAPTDAAKLPCPSALEFMAEIYEEDEASLPQATKAISMLIGDLLKY